MRTTYDLLLLPGDRIEREEMVKPGHGTYRMGRELYAARMGFLDVRAGYANIAPVKGKYMPRPGDAVVAKVVDITPTSWLMDIRAPYRAVLHMSEVPWQVGYGETGEFLHVGDVALTRVQTVDEMNRIQLTLKGNGLKKLWAGVVVELHHQAVPKLIGRKGWTISFLKRITGCKMFVGQNGSIWLDGPLPQELAAIEGIRWVEEYRGGSDMAAEMEEFMNGLTDKFGFVPFPEQDDTGMEYDEYEEGE